MLKVNLKTWQQTPEDLGEQALQASHPRTRERFLAPYDIAQGTPATQVAHQTQRNPQTLMEWVHRYNIAGPDALIFCHTGGRSPLCLRSLPKA
ncbi:MAG: helix-turn-helix domain-containing protein [Cyanobacteria bacterium J06639_14]